MEQQPDDALVGLSPERTAKIQLIIERTTKLKLERELLAGRYIQRDDVHADLIRRAGEAKAIFQSLPMMADRLVGKSSTEIREVLSRAVDDACKQLSGGVQ